MSRSATEHGFDPGGPSGDEQAQVARAVRARSHSAVVLDFDETLWLRNSTETYLGSLRPRSLAVLLLTILNVVRPWAWLPGARRDFLYRDWLRVLVLTVLMPWGLLWWRHRAPELGRRYANQDLLRALDAGEEVLQVVTFGFRPVVAPLLQGVPARTRLAVAGGLLDGHRVRSAGKAAAVRQALGADVLAASLVVTDSADDQDLLDVCRTPLLLRWPESRFAPAFADAYLPFHYTAKGKRPGQRYLLHHVLLEDVVLLWLAFAWVMPEPLLGAIALLLLHASFWLVYEIGYHENDHVAVLGERDPVLPAGAAAHGHRMKPAAAWMCAAALAAPGLALLAWQLPGATRWTTGLPGPTAFVVLAAVWLAYLLLARATYWIYNRLEVLPRGQWYLALQLTRSLGYALVLHTTLAGAAALTAFAVARWVPYLSYREVGRHWQTSNRFFFLVVYLLLLATAAAGDVEGWFTLQAGAVVVWLVVRSFARRHRVLPPGSRLFQSRPVTPEPAQTHAGEPGPRAASRP